MGNIFTKPEAVLLDWNAERIGYSKRANTTDWCYPDQPKNFDFQNPPQQNEIVLKTFCGT